MNTSKSLIVAVVVVAIIAIGSYFVPKGTTVVQSPQTVGSVSSADLYSPYFNVNGVHTFYFSQPMQQGNGTTTLCSFKAPAGYASSTLVFAAARFGGDVNSGTLDLGLSATAQGTSTYKLGTGTAATSTGVVFATSTTWASGTYLNAVLVALATTTGGSCYAEAIGY